MEPSFPVLILTSFANGADILLTAPSYFLIVEKSSINFPPLCLTVKLEKTARFKIKLTEPITNVESTINSDGDSQDAS